MTYILYNEKAGNGNSKAYVEKLYSSTADAKLVDMQTVKNYEDVFNRLDSDDKIIICGGDGTLNRFANDAANIPLKNDIFYYAVGSGNDFARDLGKEKSACPNYRINEYLKNLPTVTVNGKNRLFINGIGYGIDGYCCEEGDRLREKYAAEKSSKSINYTTIAIKGLLFHYKPTNAEIEVDGQHYSFKDIWLAPAMNGRFFGGGMMPTPDQSRTDPDKKLSVMVYYGRSRLKALVMFPSLFTGKHIKYKKHVKVMSGKNITVKFDRPTSLQIDGETELNVTEYTVQANAQICKEEELFVKS